MRFYELNDDEKFEIWSALDAYKFGAKTKEEEEAAAQNLKKVFEKYGAETTNGYHELDHMHFKVNEEKK